MKNTIKECFGSQGLEVLHGESIEKCIDCEVFDKCNKMTMAISIQAISTDIELIVQNGLNDGRLKCEDILNLVEL
jgi:hypothetical protein